MINTRFALHPLTKDEEQTCKSLVADTENVQQNIQQNIQQNVQLDVMPTHHISSFGDFSGFHFHCPKTLSARAAPISRKMFFGHTLVECQDTSERICQLILNKEENQERMRAFLERISNECKKPAVLKYAPEHSGYMAVYQNHEVLTKDCDSWDPEVPDVIGIYHGMVRGYNSDIREHKLFIVCSGGLEKAGDEFCNLVLDVGTKCDIHTVAISDEAWWLRRAGKRSRCRLIYELAQEFGLRIDSIDDIQAHENTTIAIPNLDTVEHDIICRDNTQSVSVLNGCTDTNRAVPGVLMKMHASEGFWIFRAGENNGILNHIQAFPCSQPVLDKSGFSICVSTNAHTVVSVTPEENKYTSYLSFREDFFKVLQDTGWDRNNGVIELIPIVCGKK